MRVIGLGFVTVAAFCAPVPLYFEPASDGTRSQCQFIGHTLNESVCLAPGRVAAIGMHGDRPVLAGFSWSGARKQSRWEPVGPAQGTTRYIRPEGEREAPHYLRVQTRDIYPGIDAVIYGNDGSLEYDLIVRAGVDPRVIRIQLDAGAKVRISPSGAAEIDSGGVRLIHRKPVAYQPSSDGSRQPVEVRYVPAGRNALAMAVGSYDTSRELVIDPVLETAIFGGSGTDTVAGGDGARSIIGTTTSFDFPLANPVPRANRDIFVYTPESGFTLIVGGSGDDVATCAHVQGTLYYGPIMLVGGYTNSRDFPVQVSSGQRPQRLFAGGESDGFYLYFYRQFGGFTSSYVGGSGDDRVLGVYNSDFGLYLAGSTNSPDLPVKNAFQPRPGGGLDGFITATTLFSPPFLTSYAGGPGDERILGVSVAQQAGTTVIYLAGESNSLNIPSTDGWLGRPIGSGDGFVMSVKTAVDGEGTPLAYRTRGRWLAGSAGDRATGVAALSNGNVAVVGVTGSSDLETPGLPALGFSGGATDAFLARFGPGLSAQSWTRLGGSGADEALSVAASPFEEILVGGWTSSRDFPQRNGLQPEFGGGETDGFVYAATGNGEPLLASFVGGPGADRIRHVAFDESQGLVFSGDTDGPRINASSVTVGNVSGPTHGFHGRTTLPILRGKPARIGRDLSAPMAVMLGDPSNYVGVPVTISSGDAGLLLLRGSDDDAPGASLTISTGLYDSGANSQPREPEFRRFRAECLGLGRTQVNFAAPGYQPSAVDVDCVFPAVQIRQSEYYFSGAATFAIPGFTVSLDEAGEAAEYQFPRSGKQIFLRGESLNTNIAKMQAPDYLFPVSTLVNAVPVTNVYDVGLKVATAPENGEATIRLSNDSGLLMLQERVTVRTTGGSLSVGFPRISKNIAVPLGWSRQLPPGTVATVLSETPDRLQYGSSLTLPPTNPYTGAFSNTSPPIFAFGMADGVRARSTVSAPGFGTALSGASWSDLYTAFIDEAGNWTPQLTVPVGATRTLRMRTVFAPDHPVQSPVLFLRPGAPNVRASVVSTNPAVGAVTAPGTVWSAGSVLSLDSITIRGAAPGTFYVQPVLEPNDALSAALEALEVHVVAPSSFRAEPVTLGKNMWSFLKVDTSGLQGNVTVRYTSREPQKLLLASTPFETGSASVTTSFNGVYLQAFDSEGTVTVDIEASNGMRAAGVVTLARTTVAWAYPQVKVGRNGGRPSVAILAVDPVTGAFLTGQLMNGTAPFVRFENSNPDVALVRDANFGNGEVQFVPRSLGETFIRIIQPEGFVDAGRSLLKVEILSEAYQVSANEVGVNMQTPITLTNSAGLPQPEEVTFSSSNSSVVQFSTSAVDAGQPTLTVRSLNGSLPQVYLQALAGPTDVEIVASSGGRKLSSSIMPIRSSFLAIRPQFGSDPLNTLVENAPSELSITASPGQSVRGGYGPVEVQVFNSRPDVVTIERPPILNSGLPDARLRAKPLSPGEATLTIVPPEGFRNAPADRGTMRINVAGQEWILPELIVGKDLSAQMVLRLRSGFSQATAASTIRIASQNPELALVSRSADEPAAPFIDIPIRTGESANIPVFVTGLASSGETQLSISAPGYARSSSRVILTPATVLADTTQYNFTLSDGTRQGSLMLAPAIAGGRNQSTNFAYRLRAGIAPLTLEVASSNAQVFSVSPSTLVATSAASSFPVQFRFVGRGSAELLVNGPAGFETARIPVQIRGGFLSMSLNSQLSRNMQDTLTVSNINSGATVTVRSSDPSRLLISTSPTAAGAASATLTAEFSRAVFYAQALTGTGTARITASVEGYDDANQDVTFQGDPALCSPKIRNVR